jgi:antitoxin component of RelBE/YafQ-DinJ toxin-antitoxin module
MIAMPMTDFTCARTEHGSKERAAAALADMGFSLSDTIRMLMVGAGEEWFPLDLDTTETSPSRPLYEFEGRQAWAFASIDNFMAALRGYED